MKRETRMGKRQVDLRGVVEEEEEEWRRKIRERKNRNLVSMDQEEGQDQEWEMGK